MKKGLLLFFKSESLADVTRYIVPRKIFRGKERVIDRVIERRHPVLFPEQMAEELFEEFRLADAPGPRQKDALSGALFSLQRPVVQVRPFPPPAEEILFVERPE